MNSADKYITNEYKALLHNATVILSIVLFAIIGINAILAIIAPSWTIRLFVSIGLIMSVGSVWLLYTAIKHFIDYRDRLVIIKWIGFFYKTSFGFSEAQGIYQIGLRDFLDQAVF